MKTFSNLFEDLFEIKIKNNELNFKFIIIKKNNLCVKISFILMLFSSLVFISLNRNKWLNFERLFPYL